jgi:hypothetical protein
MKTNKIIQFIIVCSLLISACCSLYTGKYAKQTREEIGVDTIYIKKRCEDYLRDRGTKIKYDSVTDLYDAILIDSVWYYIKYY